MQLPHALAESIESLIENRDFKAIRRAGEELSARYRSDLPQIALSTSEHRLAYLLVRLPATYAAISGVLKEVRGRVGEIRSVLDLGAGPGTAAWTAAELFPNLERVTLIERDAEMVAVGKQLAAAHQGLGRAKWVTSDLRSAALAQHDLVIAAYALGEIQEKGRMDLLKRAWEASGKALVVIEPGTPRGFASLLSLREALLAHGQHILAPCPGNAECPMAKRPGDWCHFAARLERTSLHRRLKSGELGYEDEKFSYLAFVRGKPAPTVPARILRHPVHGKGHIKMTLCEAPNLREITVTKSDPNAFRAARRAKWGDAWPPPKS
ncbi:MAG: small ribosomal subunit Rsm22 family protein [Acidobacteriia bacterium]|nr:small ribosomal subunit Rsm22 family protein [Terriglobia bacterium]